MKQKLLVFLVMVCMVVTYMPVTAFAMEEDAPDIELQAENPVEENDASFDNQPEELAEEVEAPKVPADKTKKDLEEPEEELEEIPEEVSDETPEMPDEVIMTAEEKAAGKFLYPSVELKAGSVIENGDTIDYTSAANAGARVFRSGNYLGSCCQAGTEPDNAGKAKVRKVENTELVARIAYKYGYVEKWVTNYNVISGFQSHSYASRFMHMIQMTQQGEDVWEDWAIDNHFGQPVREDSISHFRSASKETIKVPDNFECFICTPTDGKQKFMLYIYNETASCKIKKTTDISSLEAEFPVTGVQFTIYGADKQTVAKDVNGKALQNLPVSLNNGSLETAKFSVKPGTYWIKETNLPTYLVEPEMVSVTLKAKDDTVVTFKNTYGTFPVGLEKATISSKKAFYAHPENYSLEGAKYWIYDTEAHANAAIAAAKANATIPTEGRIKNSEGNTFEFVTDKNGTVKLEKVHPGTYWAAEISPSKGYLLDGKARSVKVTPASTTGKPAQFQSEEEPAYGLLKLHKKHNKQHYSHPENYSLVGAEYTVYMDEACKTPAKDYEGKDAVLITKDEDGNTNTLKLELGEYYVKETKKSLNHEFDTKVYSVTITEKALDKAVELSSVDNNTEAFVYLQKKAAKTNTDFLKEAPNNYTLEGATYELYTDASCTKRAKDTEGKDITLVTDKNGKTQSVKVDIGKYYAKEVKAAKGYKFEEADSDTGAYPGVDVTKENIETKPACINSVDDPTYKIPTFKIEKYDSEGKKGWDRLIDAYYQISYYDITCGYGGEKNPDPATLKYTKPTRKWVFKTRKMESDDPTKPFAGFDWGTDDAVKSVTLDAPVTTASGIKYKAGDKVTSDEFYTENGKRIMPVGFYTIEEISAPVGLARNELIVHGKIYQEKNGAAAKSYQDAKTIKADFTPYEESAQNVTIAVQKVDAETGKNVAQGQKSDTRLASFGSLAGATYNVYFNNDETKVNEIVGTIVTNKDGYAELTKRTKGRKKDINKPLEPGIYYIEEVKASPGYVLDGFTLDGDKTVKALDKEIEVVCSYKDDGEPVTKKIGGNFEQKDVKANIDYKGDVDNETAVEGKIGAHHVFHGRVNARNVLNFKFISPSEDAPHETVVSKQDITGAELPGATLQVFNSNKELVESWVSTDKPHLIKALPDGDYMLREITAPYGYDIAEDVYFTVEQNVIKNKVEMKNKPLTVETDAKDVKTKTHQGAFGKEESIIDNVKMTGLYEGRTYRLDGVLMDKNTNKPFKNSKGEEIKAEPKEFVATGDEMEVQIVFKVDSSEFTKNTTLVAFEYLSRVKRLEGRDETNDFPGEEFPKELQKHADINDEDQTVHYGGIVETVAKDKASLSKNILADKNVTIVDTVKYQNLSLKEKYVVTGELFDKTTGQLTGIKGKTEFTPETPDGEIIVEFTFDASELKNHDLVAFEDIAINGVVFDEHKNPDDEKQTMHVPEIFTTATAMDTNDHISLGDESVEITDVVVYHNLLPGEEYVMNGTLMNKKTGEALNVEGSTASVTFTPAEKDGTVELKFNINASNLLGETVVAFEECTINKVPVAVHADLEDEEQSVHIPEIFTTATAIDTKDHVTMADESVEITDSVVFHNLIPGKEYVMSGKLMNKATGEALTDEGAVASATFTPEEADGTVELKFTIDGSALANQTVVAFEECTLNGVLVAVHADIEDEDQSVHIPEIFTTATALDTNDHITYGDKKVKITDAVVYHNLVPGKKYVMNGTLMSKNTGKPVDIEGTSVSKEFTPKEADGVVELTFKFDGRELAGDTVVAFEECTLNDVPVAVHADIEDADQSVYIPKIETEAELEKATKTVHDKVMYENLMPGKYVMKGWLVNTKTGKKLKDSDGEFEFEIEEDHASGYVFVDLPVNGYSKLAGYSLTAFEELYYIGAPEDGEETEYLVADHKDKDDEAQIVKIPGAPKTGDNKNIFIFGGIFLVAVLAGGIAFFARRKKSSKEDK